MIAVTYLFSAIAVVLLPFVKTDLWQASPASRIKLFGVQIVPVAGLDHDRRCSASTCTSG